jgi:hypothetical protein
MLSLRRLALTFLSMCVLPVSAARAQAVALDLAGCAEPAAAEVRALASLELRGRLREPADGSAEQEIVVTCSGERAELRSTERGDVRVLELGSVPAPLRARLLALAIAELASVPGSTPASREQPALVEHAQAAPPAQSAAASAPLRAQKPWLGSAAIVAAGVKLSVQPVVGAAASFSSLVRVFGPLSWTGALTLGQTRRAIDGGRLRVRSLVLRSGPGLRLERARWLTYGALAARLELLELLGEPRDRDLFRGARVRTFVIGPALFAGVALALTQHLLIGLEAELSHQLRAVDVQVRGGQTSTLSPWRVSFDALVGARW